MRGQESNDQKKGIWKIQHLHLLDVNFFRYT